MILIEYFHLHKNLCACLCVCVKKTIIKMKKDRARPVSTSVRIFQDIFQVEKKQNID